MSLTRREFLITTATVTATTPLLHIAGKLEAAANIIRANDDLNPIPDSPTKILGVETEPLEYPNILSIAHSTDIFTGKTALYRFVPESNNAENPDVTQLDRPQIDQLILTLDPNSPLCRQLQQITSNVDSSNHTPSPSTRHQLLPRFFNHISDSGIYFLINHQGEIAIVHQLDNTHTFLTPQGQPKSIDLTSHDRFSVAPEITGSKAQQLHQYYDIDSGKPLIASTALFAATLNDRDTLHATAILYESDSKITTIPLTSPHINLSGRKVIATTPEFQPSTELQEVPAVLLAELSPGGRIKLFEQAKQLLPHGSYQHIEAFTDTDGSVVIEISIPNQDNPTLKERLTYRPVWIDPQKALARDLSGINFALTLPEETFENRLPNHAPTINVIEIPSSQTDDPIEQQEQQLTPKTELPTLPISDELAAILRPTSSSADTLIRNSSNTNAVIKNFPIAVDINGNITIQGLDLANLPTNLNSTDIEVVQVMTDLAHYIVNDTVDYPSGAVSLQVCITQDNRIVIAPYFEQTVTSYTEGNSTDTTPAETLKAFVNSALYILDTKQPGFDGAKTTLHAVTNEDEVVFADIPEEFRPRVGSVIAIQYTFDQETQTYNIVTILIPDFGVIKWLQPTSTSPITPTQTPANTEDNTAVVLGPKTNLEALYKSSAIDQNEIFDSQGNYNGILWTGINPVRFNPNIELTTDSNLLSGTITIDGTPHPIISGGVHDDISTKEFSEVTKVYLTGLFLGFLGTRAIKGFPIDGIPENVEVADCLMEVTTSAGTKLIIFSFPSQEMYLHYLFDNRPTTTHNLDEISIIMSPGNKISISLLFPNKNTSWEKLVSNVLADGNLNLADQNLLSAGIITSKQKDDILSLSTTTNDTVYVGVPMNIAVAQ